MSNLVVATDEVDDVTGSVGQHTDGAALYERRQRVVDVDLTPWHGEDHVNLLLCHLLRQLAHRRVVLHQETDAGLPDVGLLSGCGVQRHQN